MKLGLQLGYWTQGPEDPIDLVLEAERLGFDSAWTAEAYGSDCFSPLCWLGSRTSRIKLGTAVMQLSARTPACAAMTAMTNRETSSTSVSTTGTLEGAYTSGGMTMRISVVSSDGVPSRVPSTACSSGLWVRTAST